MSDRLNKLMSSITEIIADINSSTEKIISATDNIDETKFNQRPGENLWSIGDVIEHLCILEQALNSILKGDFINTSDRAVDEKIEEIKKRFLNFEVNLEAGEQISPSKENKVKNELLARFQKNRNELINLAGSIDLTKTYLGFKHAIFGYLTGCEWIYFCIYHTERHLNQIETIKNKYL